MSEIELTTMRVEGQKESRDLEANSFDSSEVTPKGAIGTIDYKFNNLSLTVVRKKFGKRPVEIPILKSVSGELKAGRVTAILGASGAGKSSLLNVLAGRVQNGGNRQVSGKLTYNGKEITPSDLRHTSSYVMQDDVFLYNLTTREQIMFAANMSLSDNVSRAEKERKVDSIIKKLRLEKCANTYVGGAGVVRGISGGERKRCAIGVELVTDPMLLFLDEPTSGLDSDTAAVVVEHLRDIAHKDGRTVAFTIHQPSSEVFSMFDDVILLSEGKVVYFGPQKDLVGFLEGLGHPVPAHSNPADFVMTLLHNAQIAVSDENVEAETNTSDEEEAPRRSLIPDRSMPRRKLTTDSLIDGYSTWKDSHQNLFPEEDEEEAKSGEDALFHRGKTVGPSARWKVWYLFVRGMHTFTRNKPAAVGKVFQYIFVAFFSGLLFWQQDTDTPGIQGRVGGMFSFILLLSFMPANGTTLVFPLERPVFLREHAKKWYHPLTYYISKTLCEAPFQIFIAIAAACTFYYMIGLNSGPDHLFKFILVGGTVALIGSSIGLIVGGAIRDVGKGMELSPSLIIPQMLAGGLFVNVDAMPKVIQWFSYISFVRWANQALLNNEFRDEDVKISVYAPTGNGTEILEFYSFEDMGFWECWGILAGMMIIYRLIAYFVFWFTAVRSSLE